MVGKLLARTVAVVAMGVTLAIPFASPASAQDMNCDSFASQADAQANLRVTWPSDPNDLDRDGDGVACEDSSYPAGTAQDLVPLSGAASSDTAVPTGGTSTGFGGMAENLGSDSPANRTPLLAGTAAAAAAGIAWTLTRRRHHT